MLPSINSCLCDMKNESEKKKKGSHRKQLPHKKKSLELLNKASSTAAAQDRVML